MMRSDLPRITIPRERHQLFADRAADYSLKRPSWQLAELPNGMDTNLGQPRPSGRPHSPHQLDRQVMKEIQFGLGIDDHQPVRLGHLGGNFRKVLGAGHTDRDWQAKLRAYSTTYRSGDLSRRAEKVSAPCNVSKGLVDRNPLDERSKIAEHGDGSIAEPLIVVEMSADKDQLRTKLLSPPPRHTAANSKGFCLVGRSEDHASADGDRFSAQRRIEQLLD